MPPTPKRLAPPGYQATPLMQAGDYIYQGYIDGLGDEHVWRKSIDGSMPIEVVPRNEIIPVVRSALHFLKSSAK